MSETSIALTSDSVVVEEGKERVERTVNVEANQDTPSVDSDKLLICKNCDSFSTSDSKKLSEHEKWVHNVDIHDKSVYKDEDGLVCCDQCNFECDCEEDLLQHKRVHIDTSEEITKKENSKEDIMASSPVESDSSFVPLKSNFMGEDLTNNNAMKSFMPASDFSKETLRNLSSSSSILLSHSIEKQLQNPFIEKTSTKPLNGYIGNNYDMQQQKEHNTSFSHMELEIDENIKNKNISDDDDDEDNIELVIDEDVDTESNNQISLANRRHSSSTSDDISMGKKSDIFAPVSSPYTVNRNSYINPYAVSSNGDVISPLLTSNAIDMMRSAYSKSHQNLPIITPSMASQNPAISQHLNHIIIKPQSLDDTTPSSASINSSGYKSGIDMSGNISASSHTPASTPVKRCAPVREAVDPAKYITVQEGDGIKYACSKCGNIYKWRKSLNKHWKEKHEGEIPEPRSASMNNIPLPRISATSFRPTVGVPRTGTNMMSQVSPRNNSHTSPKDQYNTLANLGRYKSPLMVNPFSPKMNPASFSGSGYSTSTPKQQLPNNQYPSLHSSSVDAYLRSPKQNLTENFANSTVMQYLKQRGPLKIPQDYNNTSGTIKLGASNNVNSQISPPAAHSNKPVPQYIPPRPVSTDTAPIDLTRDLPLALPQSKEPEGILDLSRKRTSTPRQPPLFVLPPQDEPLDFSKKKTTSNKEHSLDDMEDKKHYLNQLQSSPIEKWNVPLPSPVEKSYNSIDGSKHSIHSPPHVPVQNKKVLNYEAQEPMNCHVCTYVTRDKDDMDLHMQLHSTDASQYVCAECQDPCKTLESLNQHFAVQHMKSITRHISEMKTENTNGDTQQNTGPQLYRYLTMDPSKSAVACLVCGAMYQWQWALAKHFEQDHVSLPNPYQIAGDDSNERITSSPSASSSSLSSSSLSPKKNLLSPYKCSHCPYYAETKSDLTRHQIRHTLNKHHVCKVCGYTARSKGELSDHYTDDHPNVDPYELKSLTGTVILNGQGDDSNNSGDRMLGPDGLLELTDSENTAIVFPQAPEESNRSKAGRKPKANSPSSVDVLLPYKCTACEYRARWPSEITQHMKNHSDDKPFLCPRCTYRSKWKWDVVKHLKRCGGGTVKDVIDTTRMMKKCSNNSGTNSSYGFPESMAYAQGRELSNGPPNVTVVPGSNDEQTVSPGTSEYTSNHPMDNHSVHSTDDDQTSNTSGNINNDPLECSKCSFVACSPAEIRRHSKFHSYDANQVYCTQCPFVGNNPAELKRHLRVHSDEKPFVCKTCGYSSKWKCDLKKHCNTYNHMPAVPLTYGGHGRKPNSSTINNTMLGDEHIDSNEDGDNSDEAQDMYNCELCTFQSTSLGLYNAHMKIHLTNNTKSQFRCKQCDFEGEDLPTFLQHKLSHTTPSKCTSLAEFAEGSEGEMLENGDIADPELMDHSGSSSRRKQPKKTIMKNLGLDDDLSVDSPNSPSKFEDEHFDATYTNKMYICSYCPYRTPNRANYSRHMPHHETLSKYSCEWCNWSSDRLNLLYRHAQVIHPQQILEQDKETFFNRVKEQSFFFEGSPAPSDASHAADVEDLPRHVGNIRDDYNLMKRTEENPIAFSEGKKTKRRLKTCGKCGYITDNVTTLQRHMAKHGKLGKYTCTHCDYSVDKQHVLEYHIRLVHAKQMSNINLSGFYSGSIDNLDNASNSSTIDFNDNASIGNCSSVSDGGNIADEEGVNLESADISTVQGEDVKIVHVGTRTVYGCTKCPYHTMKISGVLNHSRQHGQKKRFSCTYCDYSVDQSAHVKNHMKTVHGHNVEEINLADILRNVDGFVGDEVESADLASNGNDSEINEEEYIEYGPESKRARMDNMSIMNKQQQQSVFRCLKCAHVASDKIEWLKHKLLHMDEPKAPVVKSHLCNRCPYRTGNRSQLEAHKTRHGVPSKYDCHYCDYSCGNATQQGNHVKLHFPDKGEIIDKTTLQILIKGESIDGYVPVFNNDIPSTAVSPSSQQGDEHEPVPSLILYNNGVEQDSAMYSERDLKINNTDINCNTAGI